MVSKTEIYNLPIAAYGFMNPLRIAVLQWTEYVSPAESFISIEFEDELIIQEYENFCDGVRAFWKVRELFSAEKCEEISRYSN